MPFLGIWRARCFSGVYIDQETLEVEMDKVLENLENCLGSMGQVDTNKAGTVKIFKFY